jgi:hypothetical protein
MEYPLRLLVSRGPVLAQKWQHDVLLLFFVMFSGVFLSWYTACDGRRVLFLAQLEHVSIPHDSFLCDFYLTHCVRWAEGLVCGSIDALLLLGNWSISQGVVTLGQSEHFGRVHVSPCKERFGANAGCRLNPKP